MSDKDNKMDVLPIKEVYEDLLHPTLSTVGQELQGVARLALSPLSGLIWCYDKIAEYLDKAIPAYFEKRKIKKENIKTPDLNIAVPTIEALRYTSGIPELRDMFTNLLGASMNSENHDEHPAFVEIIKQLSPDECRMLKYLMTDSRMPMLKYRMNMNDGGQIDIMPYYSNICRKAECQFMEKFPEYLNNLHRLGLIEVYFDRYLFDDKYYEELRNDVPLPDSADNIIKEKKSFYELSEFGKTFCRVCIS